MQRSADISKRSVISAELRDTLKRLVSKRNFKETELLELFTQFPVTILLFKNYELETPTTFSNLLAELETTFVR